MLFQDQVSEAIVSLIKEKKLFTVLDVVKILRKVDPTVIYKEVKQELNYIFENIIITEFENYARVRCKFEIDGQEKKAFIYYPCNIDSDDNVLTAQQAKYQYDKQNTLNSTYPSPYNLQVIVENIASEYMSDNKFFTAFDITKEIRKTQQVKVNHYEVKTFVEKFYSELINTSYTKEEFHFVKDSDDYWANMYLPYNDLVSRSKDEILEIYYKQFETPVPVCLTVNIAKPVVIPISYHSTDKAADKTDVSVTLVAKHNSGDTQTDAKIKTIKDIWNLLFA
jgi:hypothetical protein